MIGVYKKPDGTTFEREYNGIDELGGGKLWKLRSGHRRKENNPFAVKRAKYHVTSQCFMEWEGKGQPGMEAPAYDKDGNPAFETERQARDFAQKHGMYYGDRGGHHPRWV